MQSFERFFYRVFWVLHRWTFKLSGGRIGSRIQGLDILLLYSTGRKSGQRRENMLTYLPHGEAYLVAASNAGASRPSGWYFNLKAHPETQVLVKGRRIKVSAREAEGAEREELWKRFLTSTGGYERYADLTDRVIPVMVLEPQ